MQRNPMKVAIQGGEASFHEIAAYQHYENPIELIYCQTFGEVFEKLVSRMADRAFVAVANTRHGDIDEVKRLMMSKDFVVEGEYLLPIEQHVIGLDDTSLNEVTKVISHPVALSQCSIYLRDQLGNAAAISYYDTSAAVDYVKQHGDRTIVAIGSESAAKLYGLKILQRSVQDDPHNATLFKSLDRTE